MRSKMCFLTLLLIISVLLFAAKKPDWVENNGFSQKHPDNLYIVGFGLATGNDLAERKLGAEQYAKTDLSSRFLTKIQSELLTTESETNLDYDSQIKSTITSQTNLTLIGLKTEFYEDKKITYALAILKIVPALKNYQNHLNGLSKEINGYLANADKLEKSGDLKTALSLYRKTFPLFIELGETQAILNLLRGKDPFKELESVYQQSSISQSEVESRIQKLIRGDLRSISSASISLSEQLSEQISDRKISLLVFPFTFQETDFCSEFSAYFLDDITRELTGKFTVLSDNAPGANKAAQLTGNYRLDGGKCRIQAVITDPKSGKKMAAAAVVLDKSIIKNSGVALVPRNFEQAMEDGKIFLSKDVISGKLSVEAWTNKGNRNIIFKEGDESTLLVRVNKPCYLQVLYHLADGMRILMYNNLYIDVSKVNMVYSLPDTFYVAPPFGVERWQIFANTERFPEVLVKTQIIDGEKYEDVLAEDIEKFTMATRGMKKKKPEIQMAEKTITLTTMRR
ncbi:MAG: DUF4384 domain-containing protein [Candidatus Marinimicrobia bacterium]|nr:DUF4384 domain-containing protein [Candidatus Neomarinimicrobiota bacterium]